MELLVVGLAGFFAALVDGALGMGFGPTSSSILLGTGMSPAAVATTVNIAKVASGIAGAISHWRFGNIGRRLTITLALPGCAGALIGVTVLANVDGATIRPFLAVMLLAIGIRILVRFSRPLAARAGADGGEVDELRPDLDTRATVAAATAGGVTNGLVGAWGPVVTPFLLHHGVAPRVAIGSVNTAEVAVAVVASGSLLASIGGGDLEAAKVVAMLVGGVIAAPIAAWVIRYLPARSLGVAVAALLFVTNIRELAGWADLGTARWVAYGAALVACAWGALRPRRLQRLQVAVTA